MENAILYLRVSSKEQLDGSSIETQGRICTDYAVKNDFNIDKIFIEKGESAKTTDRTELQAMLEYIAKNSKDVSAVIIYKIDRLARNALDHATIKLLFIKYGVKLVSATENLEDTPVGRLIENQLAGFAQFDNEIRTERSTNGMIAAVKAGRYVWRAPLGYVNTGGRGISNIQPDKPTIVQKVQKIWEFLDTGYMPEEARKMATDAGLSISKSQFHRMIRNKIYMGVIEKFGLSQVGSFEPLIESQLFMRVLGKIEGRSKRMPIYRVNNPDFPIRGLVRHDCYAEMTASWSSGNGGKYGYYRCMTCKGVNYKKENIEGDFVEYLNRYGYKPHLKAMLLKAIEVNLDHKFESKKKRSVEIEKETVVQKVKISQIVEKNLKGVLSDYRAKEMIQEAEEEITSLTLENTDYEVNKEEMMSMAEKSLSYLEDISSLWLGLEPDIVRRFQNFLFPSGVLYDGEDFRTDKTALCISLKQSNDFNVSHLVTPTGVEPVLQG